MFSTCYDESSTARSYFQRCLRHSSSHERKESWRFQRPWKYSRCVHSCKKPTKASQIVSSQLSCKNERELLASEKLFRKTWLCTCCNTSKQILQNLSFNQGWNTKIYNSTTYQALHWIWSWPRINTVARNGLVTLTFFDISQRSAISWVKWISSFCLTKVFHRIFYQLRKKINDLLINKNNANLQNSNEVL